MALSANAIAYGISKFLMGGVSDRSSARKFLPLGLVLSALVTLFWNKCRCFFIVVMFITQFDRLVPGMGWPPSGRVMTPGFPEGTGNQNVDLERPIPE